MVGHGLGAADREISNHIILKPWPSRMLGDPPDMR